MQVSRQQNISRTAAQELIRNGYVKVNGIAVSKPGMALILSPDVQILISSNAGQRFASRGGDKLNAALVYFGLDVTGQLCLDVGASTGGFTDCLLRRGASKIYAVENGKGQLAPQLKGDPRVISMEQTDIREAKPEWFNKPPSFAAVDVSFISLTKVLLPIKDVLAADADIICLVKPQFEAGRGKINKRGIVKDPKIRRRAVDDVCAFAHTLGLNYMGRLPFPDIPKKDKNQEFLVYFTKFRKKVNDYGNK